MSARPRWSVAWAALLAACSAGQLESGPVRPDRPLYKPGQSLDARRCTCTECFDRACCGGDPFDVEPQAPTELGVTLSSCSRCVERVWPARGNESCATFAPPECCASPAEL